MKVTVTIKIKLEVTRETDEVFKLVRSRYAQALNLTSKVAFEQHVKNSVALHHLTYNTVRNATELPANLVCSARNIVAEAYKREIDKLHKWKDTAAIRYDARTLKVDIERQFATLSTLQGRVRVTFAISEYHRQYFDGTWEVASTAALLNRKGIWYLHLTAEKEVPPSSGDNVIGLDAGIKKIATLSTGKTFKGGVITQLRKRRFKQRRSLQTKPEGQSKSRNQRRLLKRLSGQERRAAEWKLWNVANGVVAEAVRTNCRVVAIEDLKGIRDRIRVARNERIIQHGWAFSSLFQKVRHVASKVGIKVAEVSARDTSQTCSRCGHCEKANRKTQANFKCVSCDYSHNADLNASYNIRERYVSLECPTVNLGSMSVNNPQGC